MRWLGISAGALLISGAASAFAEETLLRPTAPIAPARGPAIAVPAVKLDVDDPQVAARRFQAALFERLKPIEARFREDPRLRRAGAIIGFGAVAAGALRHKQPLTAVGTGALRLGFGRQLSTLQRNTGFSVSPTLERRGFSISLTRRFQ
jgi:hypothetical protein